MLGIFPLPWTPPFPPSPQEWEAAAQFHRRGSPVSQAGWGCLPTQAGWAQEELVPRQAEGSFLGNGTVLC